MGTRRKSRELALQMLFQADMGKQDAEHLRMERMAAVDRNLLRAAVAELLVYPETPRAVVINEALEIARKFSSPESVHFVNGVLDSIGKELETKSSCP